MNPGRELDALIAEKVMGWKELKTELLIETGWDLYGVNPEGKGDFLVPEYSTDIAAAWEILTLLVSRGSYVSVFSTEWSSPTRPKAPGWACQIDSDANTQLSDNIPHVISLAALKAVGVDIEKD